jgi:hypothetical protein
MLTGLWLALLAASGAPGAARAPATAGAAGVPATYRRLLECAERVRLRRTAHGGYR